MMGMYGCVCVCWFTIERKWGECEAGERGSTSFGVSGGREFSRHIMSALILIKIKEKRATSTHRTHQGPNKSLLQPVRCKRAPPLAQISFKRRKCETCTIVREHMINNLALCNCVKEITWTTKYAKHKSVVQQNIYACSNKRKNEPRQCKTHAISKKSKPT